MVIVIFRYVGPTGIVIKINTITSNLHRLILVTSWAKAIWNALKQIFQYYEKNFAILMGII
jgi:hypothetical protein